MVELSLAYFYAPDMTPGTWQGQPYDGVMRQIMGNHLALVEEGRAGHDVAVRDAKPNKNPIEEAIMSFFKRKGARDETPAGENAQAVNAAQEAGQALMALQKLLPDGTVVEITDDEDKAAMIRELVERAGLEADLEPEQLKKLMDTLNDLAYSPAAGDADGEDKCADADQPGATGDDEPGFETDAEKRAFEAGVKYAEKLMREPGEKEKLDREHESEGEKAGDEDAAEKAEKAEKTADAALREVRRLQQRMARAQDAAREVRPVLGDLPGFNAARDSAEKLYRRALDELGVNHAGVPDAAVRALYMAAQASGVSRQGMVNPRAMTAQDAADMAPEFAHLKNIRKSY